MTRALRRAALALALALPPAAASAGEPHRFALVAGEPDGGPGTVRLRYAERDARRMLGILTSVGGVQDGDARLLLSGGAGAFRRALAELSARAGAARARGERTLVLVYYSGHARDGALLLRGQPLPLAELRAALEAAPADVRIGLLDSCQAGAITRAKGVRPAPSFEVTPAEGAPSGLVLIASSAADEDSQESDAIGASYFTHHLASGLLGGADVSGDGKVTLSEAYAYAYQRTVGATAGSAAGVQHPVFLYDLGGAGDVVLSDLAPVAGGLVFPAEAQGLYVVLDANGRAVAEVAKAPGGPRRVALPPGRYTVKKRLGDDSGLLVTPVSLGEAPVLVDDARMDRLALQRDPQKGFGGRRWAATVGVGSQAFFDRAERSGLFPPALLAGAELAARDDLGHDLVWGMDLAAGGGSGTAAGPGGAPGVRFDFTELAGGLSLRKEWRLHRLTLSGGVRVGYLYLSRTFAPDAQLPAQDYHAVVPGLTAGAAWAFTPRLSAVLRGRVSWLHYSAKGEKDQSLGIGEVLGGVEYAFGE
ncbi:MAG: caspase family protein [Anaeromyxobacter sp.]